MVYSVLYITLSSRNIELILRRKVWITVGVTPLTNSPAQLNIGNGCWRIRRGRMVVVVLVVFNHFSAQRTTVKASLRSSFQTIVISVENAIHFLRCTLHYSSCLITGLAGWMLLWVSFMCRVGLWRPKQDSSNNINLILQRFWRKTTSHTAYLKGDISSLFEIVYFLWEMYWRWKAVL